MLTEEGKYTLSFKRKLVLSGLKLNAMSKEMGRDITVLKNKFSQ